MTESVTPKVSRHWYKHPLVVVPCVLVLTASLAYGFLAWRYWSNPPKLSRNYASELNARMRETPEEERAWPKYRVVIAELDKGWQKAWESDHRAVLTVPEVAEFVQKIEPTLEIARQASRLPKLCYFLGDEPSKDDMVLFPGREFKEPSENPELWTLSLLPVRGCKAMVVSLRADALLAARLGNSDRALKDLSAVMSFANHLLELPFLVTDLQSRKTYAEGLETWGMILSEYPDLFSETQLRQLEQVAKDYAEGDICVSLAGERLAFADVLQRNYTDDGQGDGYFFPTSTLSMFGGGTRDVMMNLAAPFVIQNRSRFAARRELSDAFNQTIDEGELELAVPFWNRVEAKRPGPCETQLEDPRYRLARLLLPNVAAVSQSVEETIQQRDAILLASALVRYRQRSGHWPVSIEVLAPDYIPAVPLDRLSGEQLRYKIATDGPIIYSCGPDKADDHGIAAQIPFEPATEPFYRPPPIVPFGSLLDAAESPPPAPATTEWRWALTKDFDTLRGDWILWPPEPKSLNAKPLTEPAPVQTNDR